MTKIRSFPTSLPITPECASCEATLVGPDGAPAITVAWPTWNPKRAQQMSYCESCFNRFDIELAP